MQYTKYMITTTHIYSQLRVEMAKLWDFPGIMHIVRECEQAYQLIYFSCFSFPSKLGFVMRKSDKIPSGEGARHRQEK